MVNYVGIARRIAKTDRVVKRVLNEAAVIEDRRVINTHAFDKLLVGSTLFEARMKAMVQELEKFKQ